MTFDPKSLKRTIDQKVSDILFSIGNDNASGRYYFGSSDFGLYEFDEKANPANRVRFEDGHQSYVTGLVVAGKHLISVSYDRKLIWWDRESRKPVRTMAAHDRWIRRIVATADQRRVVTIADDMLCKVWDVETGELVAAFSDHRPETPHRYPSMLYALAVSADGSYIATGDKVGHVAIWDAMKFVKMGELESPIMYTWDAVERHHSIGGIRSLAFSPDGTRLAVGGIGTIGNIDHLGGPSRLEVFEWQTGKQLFVKEDSEHKGLIEQILWGSDASWILTAGGDHKGFLSFWNAETGDSLHQETVNGHIHGLIYDDKTHSITAVGHEHISRWQV